MKKIIKKIGWILFLGLIACVIIGALVSFLNFAISAPLLLLKTIVPIDNNAFLVFLTIIVIFAVGLLMNYFLTTGVRLGKNKLFENCKVALTEDDNFALVMSEQPCFQEEKKYFNIFKSFTHPFLGELKPISKNKLRFLANSPEELITLYASYGSIPLKNLIFINESKVKSQPTNN